MAERTIYAASMGSYSDYGVMCLFENFEDAIAYVAKRNGVSPEDQTWYDETNRLATGDKRKIKTADEVERAKRVSSDRWAKLHRKCGGYQGFFIEQFDLYPPGEVPVSS